MTTHANDHVQVGLTGQRDYCGHTAAPNATKMNEEVLEKQERWSSKVDFWVIVFLL